MAPLLVFDLDGTLVDTAPDLMGTLNHVLETHGLPAAPAGEIMPFISGGARRMIVAGAARSGSSLEDVELDRLFELFLEHYSQNICVKSRAFPGVLAAMDRLEAAGWRFAVCTNKRTETSRLLLSKLGILERFAALLGVDAVERKKPDPGHLIATVEAAGGETGTTLMIGDSAADIGAAKAANVPVIGVTFGYSDRPVAELAPDFLLSDYAELTVALAERLLARKAHGAA
ncbi:HAD-IA family hydrolase [Afifella sp. IM 167]|uniref:HAD-IA family hydrolase n=1 Tax=Afifella sp. IM 167 TaxID=2033586 RepID=UPI001CC9C9F5|nr:HAD-IA family hydrolase [Afifella sp. IM 167]MBZ8134179.1 phosphoglycolate phosphatase [Afifella sp. IM 167]